MERVFFQWDSIQTNRYWIIKNLNPEIFEVTQYCEQQDDWGIGFAKIKWY